jgi:hypothetical protein
MMVNPACYWVIARLPLGAGGVGELLDQSGAHGDLALDEFQTIRRHLSFCSACRDYEASMHRAAEALAVAALHPPVASTSQSVWLDLERRIAEHGELGLASTSTTRTARFAAFARISNTIRGWAASCSDQRWHAGWLRDLTRELLDLAREFSDRAISGLGVGSRPRLAFIVVSGLAAVVIAVRVGIPALNEREIASNAVIAANEKASVESTGATLVESPEHPTLPADGDGPSDRQLAQVESAPARDPETTPPTTARVEAPPVSKTITPPTRFNFDLDRGTPMPPDSRDPKPVY